MCGISVQLDKTKINKQAFLSTVDIISHRGPDSKGSIYKYSSGTHLALGHARLSIIDLSDKGTQPMSYDDGRFSIVYNGEIYNYLELKNDLEKKGYSFNSGTDTEVILASYHYWGKACLKRFNGMFAFCIYDSQKDALFLARDRFGIKPLYFCCSEGHFFQAGSEIKQLLCYKNYQSKVNWKIALDFIQNREFDHTSETLFDGIEQLRGGEAIDVDLGRIKFNKYSWYNVSQLSDSNNFLELSDAIDEFYYLFNDSVRLRLRADVQVGSCLSGGLDSSSIVCLANEHLKNAGSPHLQNTFSSCFEDKRYDEREFIEEVTRYTNTKSHYTFPDLHDFWNNLDRIIWHQDEPIWSTSFYAQWHVFKLAATNNVKVMLDGQGADELLGGYTGMFEIAALQSRKSMDLYERIQSLPLILRQKLSFLKRKLKNHNIEWLLEDYKKITTDKFVVENNSSIKALSIELITKYHLPALLHYEDRNSMAHSVEARVPFLDHRLVEFVLNLPDEFKLDSGVSKLLLRQSMKNRIPDKINNRTDKMGFVTPQQVWMFGEHKDEFKRMLKKSARLKPFKENNLLKWFDAMASGKMPFDGTLWRLIAFGKWCEVFNVQS